MRGRTTYKKLKLSEVQGLARALANETPSKRRIIGLAGPLGSGKTTFAKSFARALGIRRVKSPTFIVIAAYRLKRLNFYHADLYRLHHESELVPLGFSEILSGGNNVILVEWADKFPSIKKFFDAIITFKADGPDTRTVDIQTL